MFFLLVSLLSFLLLISKSLPLQLPSWASELSLLSLLLSQELLAHSIQWLLGYKPACTKILKFSSAMFRSNETESRSVNVAAVAAENEAEAAMTVLDLPELALDMVLQKLSPAGLLNMASVCTSLRDRCRSDHLWESHFSEKWGRVIGESARKEWESCVMSTKERRRNETARKGTLSCACVWPWFWFRSRPGCPRSQDESRSMPSDDSVMAWYQALESGRFRFSGQVYNREQNGHVGFMLSCYDAELSYDHLTDTFCARYPPHGQRATNIEEGVGWERVRAPPVDTRAHDLHMSDCLHDLRPGDHIEIQWRRTKEFPFGWWYGVVGHLESCDGDEHRCRCHIGDTVILEFNQYSLGSRWRRAVVDRKDHREDGNESDGFYGGIRKLCDKNEISTWRRLWPADVLK